MPEVGEVGEIVSYKLVDLCEFRYGQGNTIPDNGGAFSVYGCNGIVGSTDEYNSEDSPIIGHIGCNAGIVNWGKGKHYVTYNGTICKARKDKVLSRYLYYLLCTLNLMDRKKGSQPFLSCSDFEDIEVLLPSLDYQNYVVEILDKYDLYCNEIYGLLPLEIRKRQLQYEYYLNKLFSFKLISVVKNI